MLFSAQLTDPQLLLLAVMALTAMILLVRARRYFGQRSREKSPRTSDGPLSSSFSSRCAETPDAMAGWEVQMHDTARRLSAQLDSKMSALQALIAEADRAAARLEAAQAGAARPAATEDSGPSPHGHAEIYTLADYGYSPHEIAHRIGIPIGEVELILGQRTKS
jgi:hypothetical protein